MDFEREIGGELLVETARLWESLGQFDGAGRFRIDGVTGPDEYSAIVDNNIYTNLMAQQNLRAAAAAMERLGDEVQTRLGVDQTEITRWKRAAEAMSMPYDTTLGLHPQDEGFLGHETWDFEHTRAATRSPPTRRPATSRTTRRSPSATRRCRPASNLP